jgi:Kef-type K+ transport system membrane component KefB
VGGCSILIYLILVVGNGLGDKSATAIRHESGSHWQQFYVSVIENFHHPLAVLLAQIVTIILMARLFGWLCKLIGQPTVVGEVIAGVLLGPSLVGIYFPQISVALFPAKSMGNLHALSQVGLILYMFIVGMELDLRLLKKKAVDVMIISHASIVIPFVLGMSLAYFIYEEFAPADIPFSSFALFMGIAMSVTALPVLARIVQERGMTRTRVGMLAITCAAADDITAWCLLSAVIAIVKAGSFLSSLYTIGLSVAYVVIMLRVVKPFVQRITGTITDKLPPRTVIGTYFVVLVLSSLATELIGIHALFGGFMAGLIMPAHHAFRKGIINKLDDLTLMFLLPLFFVYTGLRTEIGLLSTPGMWLLTLAIIMVAVLGKFVGTTIAARFVGQGWKDSLVIGILMNTRGLMELIVLNIGYDLGVLTPQVFTMLVIMALATTAFTGPALNLLNRVFRVEKARLPVTI